MSEQKNTHLIQQLYAAFGRGDVPVILAAFADQFEFHHHGPPEVLPWARSRHTKDEVAEFFKVLGETLDVLAFEPRAYVAQGDKVVALGYFRARAKATGREFDEHWAMEWTLRDGKVVGYRAYDDTAAMVEALRG